MTIALVRGDARRLPLADDSVDLIVTSPPYFALRSYTDGGEHYAGQLGSEATPAEFIAALVECTREWMRVLKPTGSIWVNLGDKYNSASGGQNGIGHTTLSNPNGTHRETTERDRKLARRGDLVSGVKPKSLLGLPWRYALACIDELGLILRAEVIWNKPNGLPESVTDRVRRSHEQWFHFVQQPRYFSSVDEIREPSAGDHHRNVSPAKTHAPGQPEVRMDRTARNAAGKLPGSVWEIASQPLTVPKELGVDHFAAFPMEWPRRIVLGWSPPGGVVLDPFSGTGTTAMVAEALGRRGIGVDMSADYCRLAQWRTNDPRQRERASRPAKPRPAPPPDDSPNNIRVGSLCAGYGGIEMGLALACEAVDLRWLAEFDPALDPLHPPGVPNLGDLTLIDWSTVEPIDLLTAGFPCQPVSAAGSQLAEADPRWLWPEVHRAITALRPPRVLLENVRNLVSMRKGEIWAYILSDLTALGYDIRWLTLGACAVGAAHHRHRVFALATPCADPYPGRSGCVQRLDVQECGARRGASIDVLPTPSVSNAHGNHVNGRGELLLPGVVAALLPSPAARDGDGRGEGDAAYWETRGAERNNGIPLGAALALLPTVTSSEHTGSGHAGDGGANLRTAVTLLPTPRATDGVNGGPGQRGSAGDLAMPSAVQPEHWGRFAAAVARHAAIFGPPPAPTEPNRNGSPRLAPAFAEWLMVIPPGHVTARLPRSAALKAIGNGVCPPQLAAAWRALDDSSSSQVVSSPMTEDETAAAKPISAQIRDIQDRDATARARVVNAAMMSDRAFAERNDADRFSVAGALQAAMMELSKVWDEDASWWEASGKRGRQSTAKLRRDAAVLLRGVAVGLTLHSSTIPDRDPDAEAILSSVGAEFTPSWADPRPVTEQLTQAPLFVEPQTPAVTLDAKLTDAFGPVDPAYVTAPDGTHYCTHPADRRSLLKGGETMCTACGARNPQDPTTPEAPDVMPEHPFVTPASYMAKVDRLAFADLPRLAAALPPREALSHSYVEDMENCGLKVLLRRTAHHNPAYGVGALRPSFSLIGGTAFHTAMEAIERMVIADPQRVPVAMTSPTSGGINVEQFWAEHFNLAAAAAQEAVKNSPYENPTTWHASQGGKENYDWWLVEGGDMVRRYLDTHDAAWRAAHAIFRGLTADAGPDDLGIEMPFTMQAAPTPNGPPLLSIGQIDQVWIVQTSATILGGLGGAQGSVHNGTGRHLEIHDAKSGSRAPKSTFQLAEYAHAFMQRYPQLRDAGVPVLGRYFLARKGIWTDAVNLLEAHPAAELEYRYSGAHRAELAQFYPPKVSDLCSACSVRDYCPTQAPVR